MVLSARGRANIIIKKLCLCIVTCLGLLEVVVQGTGIVLPNLDFS
jgi:hypothetical protein